jgi:hypothetical protein
MAFSQQSDHAGHIRALVAAMQPLSAIGQRSTVMNSIAAGHAALRQ